MKNQDDEYELVLGNRQLLSGFFIVVILFAVFFAMGYIVGRNSAPAVSASAAPLTNSVAKPETVAVLPPAKPSAETAEQPSAGVDAAPQPTTHAATANPESGGPARSAPAAGDSGAAARTAPAPAANADTQLYLQVAAVRKPDAQVVIDTLRKKGFPALLGDTPDGVRFRVLVGPFSDAATLGKAKADLENTGFHPFRAKMTKGE